jgi:ubiquinone/menaquinone biosynthesis C-methylase UbiE
VSLVTGSEAILDWVADPFAKERIRAAYDAAADDYQQAFGGDLARRPLDRQMLDHLYEIAGDGLILDIGCGTGSAGSYLTNRGAHVVGVDLSIGMLDTGRRHSLKFSVCQGDMRQLPFRDSSFAAIVAYYSVHNLSRSELRGVLVEFGRVLEHQGRVLIATHLGSGEVFTDRFLGHDIATTGGTLYSEQQLIDQVSSGGFRIELSKIREPLAHEHDSQRMYLVGTHTS